MIVCIDSISSELNDGIRMIQIIQESITSINDLKALKLKTVEYFCSTCRYFSVDVAELDASENTKRLSITPNVFFGYFDTLYQAFQRERQIKREEHERQQHIETRKQQQKNFSRPKQVQRSLFESIQGIASSEYYTVHIIYFYLNRSRQRNIG